MTELTPGDRRKMLWDELRFGNYQKTTQVLHHGDKHCVVGVAFHLAIKMGWLDPERWSEREEAGFARKDDLHTADGWYSTVYNNEAPSELFYLYFDTEDFDQATKIGHWMYRLNDNVEDDEDLLGRSFGVLADLFETWDKEGAFASAAVMNRLGQKELRRGDHEEDSSG